MKFKAIYEESVGFIFPELDDEVQYKIYHERKNQELITLIKGYYSEGLFFLDYSKNTNYIYLSFGDKDAENKIKDVEFYLYTSLKEAIADLEKLIKSKSDVRFWTTPYFDKDFEQDYINPEEDHSKMIWRKKGVLWVAQGKMGKFIIKHLHRCYIGKYESKTKTFNLPPQKKISEMKALCRENVYWE